jgi:biotin carboxyl carrier protein
MFFPSPVDGRLTEICAAPGAMVITDETLAVVEDETYP